LRRLAQNKPMSMQLTSLMELLEVAPWRTPLLLSPLLSPPGVVSHSSDSVDVQTRSVASPLSQTSGPASIPWGGSFATFSSFDEHEDSGSLKVKNTFIHLDRQDCVDADEELPLPMKSKSLPNIESHLGATCFPSSPLHANSCIEQTPRVFKGGLRTDKTPKGAKPPGGRTPKVTFDLEPSVFCDNMHEREIPKVPSSASVSSRAASDVTLAPSDITILPDAVSDLQRSPLDCPFALSSLAISHSSSGDLANMSDEEYKVKNTFIQFDKSIAVDADDISLPLRSKSMPSMPTSVLGDACWSPVAGPAKVCPDSLTSYMHQCRKECSTPGSPGTPAKIAPASLAFFPVSAPGLDPLAPNSPLGLQGLPLTLCAAREEAGTISASSLEFWSDCGASSGTSSVRVKNTFIHVDKDEDPDDHFFELPAKSTSQPVLILERAIPPTAERSVVPTATRLPSASVGSALHSTGTCKPCAWFWKPESCQWGVECGHCHLCPEGELRRRKKDKQTEMKGMRAALKEQM